MPPRLNDGMCTQGAILKSPSLVSPVLRQVRTLQWMPPRVGVVGVPFVLDRNGLNFTRVNVPPLRGNCTRKELLAGPILLLYCTNNLCLVSALCPHHLLHTLPRRAFCLHCARPLPLLASQLFRRNSQPLRTVGVLATTLLETMACQTQQPPSQESPKTRTIRRPAGPLACSIVAVVSVSVVYDRQRSVTADTQ